MTTYSCVETSHHLTPGVNCRYSWKSHDIEYTFDNERNMTKKEQFEYPSVSEIGFVESDLNLTSRRIGKSSASTYSYTYNGLPSDISTKTYEPGDTSNFMTTSHSYQYDTAGNVLRETRPNGQTTVCTYGSYGIPLTKTYNQDKDTVIVETNTLTADQKSISTSTTKVNGELRAKKDFTYDTKGRITEIKDYVSYYDGVVIFADDGSEIRNFPKQHLASGKAKNSRTNYYYKKMVRIMKKMRYLMSDCGYGCADNVSSFGVESLTWNVPDSFFSKYLNYGFAFKEIVHYLYLHKADIGNFYEANGIKKLCPSQQDVDKYVAFIDRLRIFFEYDYSN